MWFGRREAVIRRNLELDRRLAARGRIGNHLLPPKTVAQSIALSDRRLRELEADWLTAAAIIDKVQTIRIEPDEARAHPWFVPDGH
jgi:hypothetical protein